MQNLLNYDRTDIIIWEEAFMSTDYNETSYENALIELFRDNMGWEHVYGP